MPVQYTTSCMVVPESSFLQRHEPKNLQRHLHEHHACHERLIQRVLNVPGVVNIRAWILILGPWLFAHLTDSALCTYKVLCQ